MKSTVNQAAKIVGATRQTIYRHIESKPISVEKDEKGNQLIDASELIRVYGNKINFDAATNSDFHYTVDWYLFLFYFPPVNALSKH